MRTKRFIVFTMMCCLALSPVAYGNQVNASEQLEGITLTDGTSSTQTYEYLGVYKTGEGETMEYGGQTIDPSFECDVYKSTDDAGEFTYFFLRDDTMEETYHIEFRYGFVTENLNGE